MARMARWLLFIFFLSALFSAPGRAQTITAASCNASDVQNALNSVKANGTTVQVPACAASQNVTYTAEVTYTGPYSIVVVGAGSQTTTGGGDATVIFDGNGNNTPAFFFQVPSGGTLRISGISIESASPSQKNNGSLNVQCNDTPGELRIDHIHLANSYVALQAVDCFGVVDHSIFDEPSSSGTDNSVHTWNPNYNKGSAGANGDGSWAAPTQPGSAYALYYESNVFNSGAANDCTFGGKQVFRFNTFNTSGLQTHPTGGGGADERGCRSTEVYENTFNASNSNSYFDLFWLSSGTMYVWGNSAPTGYNNFFTLHEQRMCQGGGETCYPEVGTPTDWGYCGTYKDGIGSAWDFNTTTGYPCIDQPGRGQGQLITGTMPNAINSSLGNIAWPNQALEPIYEWMDTWAKVPNQGGSFFSIYDPAAFTQNQDFYTSQNLTDGTNVSFTGNPSTGAGVGYGTLANRPSTCTPSVAYWATDQGSWNTSGSGPQGELFICTATNTWTLSYTPYTYPHPLVTSGGGDGGGGGSSNCANPIPVGAYTACNEAYVDVNSGTTASVNLAPAAGNGVEIIVQFCQVSDCSNTGTQTATISDNINSPEPCFTQAPHSPYTFLNSAVPDSQRLQAWYCPSIPAGVTSFTSTTNATVFFHQIDAIEWKAGSIATTNFFEDVDNISNAGATASTEATVTTSGPTVNPDDLLTVSIATCGAQIPGTVGSGYTGLIVNPPPTAGHITEAMAVTATGTYSGTTTWSSGTNNGNCNLGAGGNNDTWFGIIVPLVGSSGMRPAAPTGLTASVQ